jgi:hypothetical protein
VLSPEAATELRKCHVRSKPKPADSIIPTKIFCVNKKVSVPALRLATLLVDWVRNLALALIFLHSSAGIPSNSPHCTSTGR